MTNPSVELERVLDELNGLDKQIKELAVAAALSEAIFKTEFSKSRLGHRFSEWKSKPTEAMIEDLAVVDTEQERVTYMTQAALLDAARASLRVLTARMDGLRTLMASQRGI